MNNNNSYVYVANADRKKKLGTYVNFLVCPVFCKVYC